MERLISRDYRRLNARLHAESDEFGTTARRYVALVRSLATEHSVADILDYGCGKRELSRALNGEFIVHDYDPAVSAASRPPHPADFVVCIDVLEHVEPECLDNVLNDLARVMRRVGLVTIATRSAGKTLADGSNCHRIVKPAEWWIERLQERFEVVRCERVDGGLSAVLRSLGR